MLPNKKYNGVAGVGGSEDHAKSTTKFLVFRRTILSYWTLFHCAIMVRTILTIALVSCVFGALLGLGIAHSFLSVNAWQLESETSPYEKIVASAFAQVTNPNAKAHVEKATHNFGIMDAKTIGSHDFFIRNVGTADLILTVDRTSCSCLGIDLSQSRVLPGGTARCRLKYTAERAIVGKFSQGGVVVSNDPDNREIQLTVEGIFTNPVVTQPSSVNLSRVVAGTSRTATIQFYGFENEPLQLVAATWENREHFDFHWEPTTIISEPDEADTFFSQAKSVVKGTVTIKPGVPVGSFQEQFQVETNYPSQTNVVFFVSGQVTSGNVSISGTGYNNQTGIADLGRTIMGERGTPRELSIQFRGTMAQSASVRVNTVEPAWIRAELSPPRDVGPIRSFTLTIEIPEDAPTGSYVFGGDGQQAYILLETTDETMSVLRIPLQFVVGRQ